MTEPEWLNCADPELMLANLPGKISERKLRLFAVACCRLIWHLISDNRSRQAVETAERLAEGQATEQEQRAFDGGRYFEAQIMSSCLESATGAAGWSISRRLTPQEVSHCAAHACHAVIHHATECGEINLDYVADADACFAATDPLRQSTQKDQASMLRDIVGNPFRPLTIEPTWLTSTVKHLAETIYEQRAFDRLPILADSLEDAGCTSEDILSHFRQPGVHVRGC
jgi:hypothetical protein